MSEIHVVEEEQRKRFYERLFLDGLYPHPTAPSHIQVRKRGCGMGKKKGVKREKATPTPEPATPKREQKDEELLAALKTAYKGTPLSSREISDAAGFSDPEVGRAAVRSAMKRLIEAGRVETVKADKGRAALLYKPKA